MSTLLDVAIGVTLMYLALALVVTTIQELIASVFATRAKRLYRALADVVTGEVDDGEGGTKPLVQALYEHPLIRDLADRAAVLGRGGPGLLARGLPSYIPSRAFAVALIDVLRGTRAASDALGAGVLLANARQSLEKVSDAELRRTLTLLIGDAEQLAEGLDERSRLVSERLEGWFNDRMARAEGWYKRRAQAWSLGLALGVTLFFNADTIFVAQRLWAEGALREAAVAAAEQYRAVPEGWVEARGLPVGWQAGEGSHPGSVAGHALRVAGWLLTALAVSLGATFWFDVLSRALRLRGTGAKVSVVTGRVAVRAAEVAP